MRVLFLICLLLVLPNITFAKTVHVILDAGHGGPQDMGHTGSGFDEKTITLQLAKKIQTELEKDGDIEVVLTRIGDYPVTPNDRRKTANQYTDAVFISLHASTYDKDPQINIFALKQATWNQTSALTPVEYVHGGQYKNSIKLAQILGNEIPENFSHQITLPKFPLVSLIGIKSAAAVVECQCVYLPQPSATEANLDGFARNIAQGITTFIRKVL